MCVKIQLLMPVKAAIHIANLVLAQVSLIVQNVILTTIFLMKDAT